MQTVTEFGGSTAKMSLGQFWQTAGPVLAAVMVLIVILFKIRNFEENSKLRARKKIRDLEKYSLEE